MDAFDKLVEKHFPQAGPLQMLMEMVEKELDGFVPKKVLKEAAIVADTFDLTMIPEISISEIAWARLETPKGAAATADTQQRQQLFGYLKRIMPKGDLKEKLAALSDFYNDPSARVGSLGGKTNGQIIADTLAYLTFYKTLTTIITNFNAASAGFTFEAFLGVLLAGTQIPTGHKTIADLKNEDGIPISLKLYNEENAKVDGSYNDLVKDLSKPMGEMQYVVVMKDLKKVDPRNPLSLGGFLKFYRFVFTLKNVMTILYENKDRRWIIQLPKDFIKDPSLDYNAALPAAVNITPEQLEAEWVQRVGEFVEKYTGSIAAAENLVQHVDWANKSELFGKGKNIQPGISSFRTGGNQATRRYNSALYVAVSKSVQDGGFDEPEWTSLEKEEREEARKTKTMKIFEVLNDINESIIAWRKGKTEERDAAVKKMSWASEETSLAFYNNEKVDDETRIRALHNSKGFLNVKQFHLSRTNVIKDVPGLGLADIYPGGQADVHIGDLEVGTKALKDLLAKVQDIINKSVFEIFQNLKNLSLNINAYFAEGLEDDDKADAAQKSALAIESKTEEVKP